MSSPRLGLPRSPARGAPVPTRPVDGVITHVAVVVPARNEEALIERCLASVDHAARHVEQHVSVIVAADSCHDTTAARAGLAPRSAPMRVIEGTWRSAGAARHAAVTTALQRLSAEPSDAVWLAHTDADCVVPTDWLERQLHHASLGHDAVAGVVTLDPDSTAPGVFAAFGHAYAVDGAAHRHVHGANLGVRADAYLAAGGWSRRTVIGEDHRLWRRLGLVGAPRTQPTDVAVTTSSRSHGRVRGGFSANLRRLERELSISALADMDLAGDGYEPLVCN